MRGLFLRGRRRLSTDELIRKVKDFHVDKTPITSQLWQLRYEDIKDITTVPSPASHRDPLIKTTSASKLSIRYNFSSDPKLRDLYIDYTGGVLIGTLLHFFSFSS